MESGLRMRKVWTRLSLRICIAWSRAFSNKWNGRMISFIRSIDIAIESHYNTANHKPSLSFEAPPAPLFEPCASIWALRLYSMIHPQPCASIWASASNWAGASIRGFTVLPYLWALLNLFVQFCQFISEY